MYKLYVIPGSHACRAAMLMLEHKEVPYERVDVITLTHPVMSRLHGFDAGGERRVAGGRRTLGIRMGDLLGTVPGLDADGERVSTNRRIARFLDERYPDPPLVPDDPAEREKVEEVERWANGEFQMEARRIVGGAALRDPAAFARATADGRMGHLLYSQELARRLIIPQISRSAFNVTLDGDDEVVARLPAMLDRVDGLIGDGVLGGDQPNVADLMVASNLALILYRPDVRPLFQGRLALELVDRLLPEPA